MGKSLFILTCVLVLLTKLASSQLPCSTNPLPYSGPPIPNIPDSFSMDVVNFVVTQGVTSETIDHLYVDSNRKLAVKVEGGDYNNGGKRTIYDGNRKEAMTIKEKTCNVTKFSDLSMDPYSVYNPTNFASGNDFFRFGKKYKPTYFPNFTSPGQNVNAWLECIPSLGENKTLNISVMHLFNKNAKSGMNFVGYQTPLPGNQVAISKVHNLVLGIPFPDMLNVPSDIFCNMTQTSYKPPKMPDEFEVNVEFIMPRYKVGFNSREYMDTKEKYFRSDHLHKEKGSGEFFPVHDIHDFNTGISYEINVRTLDCEMKPLSNDTWDATETADHHHIRMRTTEEFLQLNHRNYIYEGITNVRGIPTDVFSAMFPGRRNPNLQVLLKWYFSRPDWTISGVEGPRNDTRVPIMAIYTANRTTVPVNFVNYDPIEPTNHILWPIRACYKNNRHYMYFRLTGKFDTYGATNQRSLTNAIRDTLSVAGKISRLRVSSILIFKSSYENGVVAVRVYVLGVPNIVGTVKVLDPIHETPLKDAVDSIRASIKSDKFVVKFLHKSQGQSRTVVMKANRNSYFDYSAGPDPAEPGPEHSDKKSGLTGGAVVAITVSMVIIAVFITIVVLQIVLKRRGVQLFNYSRHTNEATA